MSTRVVFAHMPRSEALETFALDHIEAVFSKFRRDKVFSSEVHLALENSLTHPGKDHYVCEVLVKSKLFKSVFLKKTSGNMYEAISLAADTLRNTLSRLHDRYIGARRHTARDWKRFRQSDAIKAPEVQGRDVATFHAFLEDFG